jgi:ABC-type lipoprotein release transport system permease subunit
MGAVALRAEGTAERGDDGAAVPQVQVVGVGAGWQVLTQQAPPRRGDCVVSQALAQDLRLAVGDELVVAIERAAWAADGTLFSHHRRDRRIASVRATVARITAPGQADHCAPWPDVPAGALRAVWLDHAWMAEAADHRDTVGDVLTDTDKTAIIPVVLRERMVPADVGLRVTAADDRVRVEATDLLLPQTLAGRIPGARGVSVYLADRISLRDRAASYATIASLDPFPGAGPRPGEVVLNAWLAEDLAAKPGDRLRLAVPVPAGDGTYPLHAIEVTVSGIVPIAGVFADPHLVPSLPGITDAEDFASWDAPFPIEMARVTPRDDAYWDRHRATPKAFLHPSDLAAIWARAGGHGRFLTGIHRDGADLAGTTRRVLAEMPPPAVIPVRQQALLAAGGSSDLGGLFLGLGIFIVCAGLGLAGAILRLGLLRRTGEAGVLRATGWTAGAVRRLHLAEGALVAIAGAAAGTALGVGLAAVLVQLLAGPWQAAGGGVRLPLVLDPIVLVVGLAIGSVLGCAVVWWATRLWRRLPILDLLAGGRSLHTRHPAPAGRSTVAIALIATVSGLAAAGAGLAGIWAVEAAAASAGVLLLVGGLAGARVGLGRAGRADGRQPGWSRLVLRSLAAAPLRALTTLALSACAAFVLVSVAAQRRDALPDRARDGGYDLIVTTTLAPGYDPGTPAGRAKLGFTAAEEAVFAAGRVVGLTVAPGDDVSCREPAKPLRPRLVGVPPALRTAWPVQPAGGWQVLDAPGADVPAVGDADSLQWILHAPPGARLPYADATLAIVGALPAGSIFAGDLLVSPERLAQLRPDAQRTRWLVDAPEAAMAATILRRRLAGYGATVTTTGEAIAAVAAVRTAYLDAFLALGGVGLFLAVLGLAALVLRSAEERRWESALLAALGVGRGRLALVIAAEQALLCVAGLVLGTVCALIGGAPALMAPGAAVAWSAVVIVLGGVCLVGIIGSAIAGWLGAVPRPARMLAEER